MLQWGRALASAEIAYDPPKNEFCKVASMGPRSCKRGNPYKNDASWREIKLQWGRALASAEMVLPYTRIIILDKASMGPRSCKRGNFEPGGQLVEHDAASMGPRSCKRGNSLSAFGWSIRFVASMGPRSCKRGNVIANLSEIHEKTGFNGAALLQARKFYGILSFIW